MVELSILLSIIGIVVSVVVGFGISWYFHHLENKRRKREKGKEEEDFKAKEAKCIAEILKGKKYRTGKWLKVLSGMTDEDFEKFREKYPELIPAGQKDNEPLYKIEDWKKFLKKIGAEEES